MTTTDFGELLPALRSDLEELQRLVGSLAEADLDRPDAVGWNARQVLAHLADFELVAAVRVRMVLSAERPALAVFGQEELVDRFTGLEPPAEALERIAIVRRTTLRVLEALSPADWERVGVHPVRGEETLRRTVEMMVHHDRGHLAQLREAAGRSPAE
jgi:uncharacterized protein (TIGR03083 family)